jgi:hypothetical protein
MCLKPVRVILGATSIACAQPAHRASSELFQEAHIVLVEHPQTGDAVLEHRNPFDADPERESVHVLWVKSVIADMLEHVRIDHPRAEDLDSALALAQRAELTFAGDALYAAKARDVDLHAWLSEGEEVRSHSDFPMLPEYRA